MKYIYQYLPKTLLISTLALLQGCLTTPNEAEMNHLLKQQKSLIAQQQEQLLAERPQHTDLYFVGFAADYSQNVFKKEALYTQALFDQRFDTKGRSTVLINNNATDQVLPLANYTNLKKTLKNVADKMNVEEDILFLFLTGHGKKDLGLSINYGPQQQVILPPNLLKSALEKSNVKWKVIVVSACFSGIYVDALENEHTLVMTASNAMQPSFGCSNTADFTYFGEAYFKNQLTTNASFIDAFEQAKVEITAKEKKFNLQHSKPQIKVQQTMINKLSELTVHEGG